MIKLIASDIDGTLVPDGTAKIDPRMFDIIKRLNEYDIKPIVVDPWASERDAMHEYGVSLTKLEEINGADCIIVAVAHNEFKSLSLNSQSQPKNLITLSLPSQLLLKIQFFIVPLKLPHINAGFPFSKRIFFKVTDGELT